MTSTTTTARPQGAHIRTLVTIEIPVEFFNRKDLRTVSEIREAARDAIIAEAVQCPDDLKKFMRVTVVKENGKR